MAKFKPHKGLSKRVRISARKKVVRQAAGRSKLMSHKSGRRCQRLRRKAALSGANAIRILRALGEE